MIGRKPVKIYVRVENNDEIMIGTARTIACVPRLLRKLADLLDKQAKPDSLERP